MLGIDADFPPGYYGLNCASDFGSNCATLIEQVDNPEHIDPPSIPSISTHTSFRRTSTGIGKLPAVAGRLLSLAFYRVCFQNRARSSELGSPIPAGLTIPTCVRSLWYVRSVSRSIALCESRGFLQRWTSAVLMFMDGDECRPYFELI